MKDKPKLYTSFLSYNPKAIEMWKIRRKQKPKRPPNMNKIACILIRERFLIKIELIICVKLLESILNRI